MDETRIDLKTAKERGILITYNPGINSDSVAELTILLALAILRKLLIINKCIKLGNWGDAQSKIGIQISGKKWGVIGFGNVGIRVAKIAFSMGCQVYAYDPYIADSTIRNRGVEPMSLKDLINECDIVSIHVPLLESTKHLIGEKELKLMKKDAVLINVSRGGIIDDIALYEAVKSGNLLGAGLDTLEDEPIHADNPLLSLENVVLTAHIGGSTHESMIKGSELAVEEVLRLLNGEQLKSQYSYKR